MFHKSFYLFFIAAAMFFSCSDDDEPSNPEDALQIEVLFDSPKSESQKGELFENSVFIGEEKRDAVLVILKGFLEPDAEIPFRFEVVRVVEAELYRDVDKEVVPNRFITHAEILNKEGGILWEEDVDSLFQVLEFLKIVVSQQSPIKLNASQIYRFVDMQYPELLEFGILVPTSLDKDARFRMTVPDEDGNIVEALNVSVASLVKAAKPSPLKPTTKLIEENGKPEDKIDIVIVSDGYQAEREKKFNGDAKAIKDRFLDTEPFKSHASDFNFHTVFLASEEGGAGYDCTGNVLRDRGCKNDIRDTAFQTTFVVSGLADRLNLNIDASSARAAMPLKVAKLYEAASSVPYDQIVLLTNTDRASGFAGLYFSVLTAYDARLEFPHVAVHELGHSFGLLGDEYSATNDACLSGEPRIPLPVNIASGFNPLKWSALVDKGAEIPTPDSKSNSVEVGAFDGAYSCEEHYRPSATCKMRDSTHEFCAVCAQQLVNRIGTTIDPLPSAGLELTDEGSALVIDLSSFDNRSFTFLLSGKEIEAKDGKLSIPKSEINTEWKKFEARATISSDFVKVPTTQLSTEKAIWLRGQ